MISYDDSGLKGTSYSCSCNNLNYQITRINMHEYIIYVKHCISLCLAASKAAK